MKVLRPAAICASVLMIIFGLSFKAHSQQSAYRPVSRTINPVDETEIVREKVADQIYLYKEVMQHLSEISESFSFGYNSPDEALKRVIVLRHAYNSKSEPLRPEIMLFHELMNKMFSRLENYFIHFKSIYREDPYLNSKIAETKFYAAQEAERLEYTYLN